MSLAHLLAPSAIRRKIPDVVARHVLLDERGAGLVVFDELVPTDAGAKMNASANGVDENTIPVWFGPSIVDPSYFANVVTLRPRVLTHRIKSPMYCVKRGVSQTCRELQVNARLGSSSFQSLITNVAGVA